MKKRQMFMIPALLGAALAGGTLAASAADPAQVPPPTAPPQDGGGEGDRQEPSYTGSVPAPQTEVAGQTEEQESAALAGLATVTADEAKATALAQYPAATVRSVSLDDENGWVVWSVDVLDGTLSRDVKVDAGTGAILAVDSDNDSGESEGSESEGAEGAEGPEGAEQESAETGN